jgi:hypothetical protein
MIARFFYRFKGAFGKISTIFLAYQLRQQKAGKFKKKRHKAAIKTSDRSGETEGVQQTTADFVRFHCPLEAWKRPVQPCPSA